MEIEELFCKRYPEYSVNGKPLHPYFDVFEEGYEQAENKYEELEKKNKNLKELIEKMINEIDKTMCLSNMREREING